MSLFVVNDQLANTSYCKCIEYDHLQYEHRVIVVVVSVLMVVVAGEWMAVYLQKTHFH